MSAGVLSILRLNSSIGHNFVSQSYTMKKLDRRYLKSIKLLPRVQQLMSVTLFPSVGCFKVFCPKMCNITNDVIESLTYHK